MYNTEQQRMKEIMEAPQKSKLYSDQLNRFLTFKNKMGVPDHHPSHEAPLQRTPLVPNESVPITPPVPVLFSTIG
jgi:hypothetical protein